MASKFNPLAQAQALFKLATTNYTPIKAKAPMKPTVKSSISVPKALSSGGLTVNQVGSYAPPSSGQIHGVSNKAPTGGGGGGPAPSGGGGQDYSGVLEQAPGMPDFDYSGYDQANAALDQSIGAANEGFNANVAEIDQSAASQKGTVQSTLEQQNKGYATQEQREQSRTEDAVNEQRRQYAEMSQGMQARYGGATGTGQFANELLGREVTRAVGQNRQKLSETINEINEGRINALKESQKILLEIDKRSETVKQQARAALNSTLAEIANAKGMLAVDRNNRRNEALQNYQSILSTVNARNAAFKQQQFIAAQDAERENQARLAATYKDNKTELTDHLEKLLYAGKLSESGVRQLEQAKGYAPGMIQQKQELSPEEKLKQEVFNKIGGVLAH